MSAKSTQTSISKVKVEANGVCQLCGSLCETLEAHHQIRGDDSSLIALCPNCHRLEHKKPTLLRKILNGLSYNRKKYLLLRIAGVDPKISRTLCSIAQGTYNSWFHDEKFNEVHSKLPSLSVLYDSQAIIELERLYRVESLVAKFIKIGIGKVMSD